MSLLFDKRLRAVEINPKFNITTETDQLIKERAKYEGSLYEFAKAAWSEVEPNEWIDAWHIKAIAEHLEALYYKKIRYLVINIPPRHGKSLLANVFFAAWVLAKDPTKRLFHTSYSHSLATKHHKACRQLIRSPWYQKYWGTKYGIRDDSDNQTEFVTDKMGSRMIASVGGVNTGFGFDYIFADDPNKVGRDSESIKIRENVIEWWSNNISTRAVRFEDLCRCILMQRSNVMDLSGFVLSQNNPDIVHLCLPLEYEESRKCSTIVLPSTNGKKWTDPRKKEGELLCPQLMSPAKLKSLKLELREYGVAGQLQQRPSPVGGSYFKREWLSWWCEDYAPDCDLIFQSWDTAMSDSVSACFSACTTWGVFLDKVGNKNLILLNMWQDKVLYPDLREMAQRLANNHHDNVLHAPMAEGSGRPVDFVLIEYASTGGPLIHDLRKANVPVKKFVPKKFGSKDSRADIASALIEGGRIWLPAKAPNFVELKNYAEKFATALELFPNDQTRDIVDSMSQAVLYTYRMREIDHPDNPVFEEEYDLDTGKKLY